MVTSYLLLFLILCLIFFGIPITLIVLMIKVSNLTLRVKSLEAALKLEHHTSPLNELNDRKDIPLINKNPLLTPKPIPDLQATKEIEDVPIQQKVEAKSILQSLRSIKNNFKLPDIIKENLIGVFGSIALVIGAVFFSLTSEIMQLPQARLGIMILASMMITGVSIKIGNLSQWATLAGWLKSIAAAIALFAALGAGCIDGLKCIDNPVISILVLSVGISINILLALTTIKQTVASLHVILSIISFCIVPQNFILLPLGTLIAGIGLYVAYRSKWDCHFLLIIIAFAIQNTLWSSSLNAVDHRASYMSIACSISIGIYAAFIHYSKRYRAPKLERLPLIAHITNWLLLTWNIYIHVDSFYWSPLVLGCLAGAGFILANVAKNKGIFWLYNCDKLISLLVMICAIASLGHFSIDIHNILFIMLLGMVIFNLVQNQLKENFHLRWGYLIQFIVLIVSLLTYIQTLSAGYSGNLNLIYFQMGITALLCWGFYAAIRNKSYVIDDIRFILSNQYPVKNPTSVSAIIGTFFIVAIYYYGFNSTFMQISILSVIAATGFCRSYKEDDTLNSTLIILLTLVHIKIWHLLCVLLKSSDIPSITSRADFIGIALLDLLLVFGNLLEYKKWKIHLHDFGIYALGIHLGLLTCCFTKEISLLLAGPIFLGLSIVALEASLKITRILKCDDDIKEKIRVSLLYTGLAFLFGFLISYLTVSLHHETIWHGISMRMIVGGLGVLSLVYWNIFYPKLGDDAKILQNIGIILTDICLGFSTLCIFVEFPVSLRPVAWIMMAILLLVGANRFNWSMRFYLYSWLYLLESIAHIAFARSTSIMPSIYLWERWNYPVYLSFALQLFYSYLCYRQNNTIFEKQDPFFPKKLIKFVPTIYKKSILTVILPIFLGMASMFAFNYENTILTLLWVVLTCIYFALGLLLKSNQSNRIAMAALAICSIRLLIFDLVQSNLSVRAIVFIGVGILMLGISVLHKKYKHRIESNETV